MNWNQVLSYIKNGVPSPSRRVDKTEAEWAELLTEEEFRITRRKGTERAFTGAYCEAHQPGKYACKCCHELLFDSQLKFESYSGWPSFTEPVADNVINYVADFSHGMQRVEVLCNVCDCHLGHVFPDGPEPTGLRYCINSASIKLLAS